MQKSTMRGRALSSRFRWRSKLRNPATMKVSASCRHTPDRIWSVSIGADDGFIDPIWCDDVNRVQDDGDPLQRRDDRYSEYEIAAKRCCPDDQRAKPSIARDLRTTLDEFLGREQNRTAPCRQDQSGSDHNTQRLRRAFGFGWTKPQSQHDAKSDCGASRVSREVTKNGSTPTRPPNRRNRGNIARKYPT